MNARTITPLDNALARAEETRKMTNWGLLLPFPLILAGVALLQYLDPGQVATAHQPAIAPWYKDPFLISILVVYAFGQLTMFYQVHIMRRGVGKVKSVIKTVIATGTRVPLLELENRLMAQKSPGHLSDLILRWVQSGTRKEVDPIQLLMDQATEKRLKTMHKKVAIHALVNRTMLKLGFLGTLIGLMMTFPPMKEAILTLDPKNVEKGMSYIEHIAMAIDGDSYAILTTLLATGYSLMIELLSIQLLRAMLGRFEQTNAFVDEWATAELSPWVTEQTPKQGDPDDVLLRQKAFQEMLLQIEKEFQGKIMELHRNSHQYIGEIHLKSQQHWGQVQRDSEGLFVQARQDSDIRMREMQEDTLKLVGGMLQNNAQQMNEIQSGLNRNVDALGKTVKFVTEKMAELVPMQQQHGRRMDELLAYERQYRSFLDAQSQVGIPRHLKPELIRQPEVN